MLRNTLIGLFVGTSLSLGGLFIDSASAQNQSDNTGSNNSDNTGINIPTSTQSDGFSFQLTPAIINQAEQLTTNIIEAFNSETSSGIGPLDRAQTNIANSSRCRIRRFSLDKPQTTNNNCNGADNSESEELNALLKEADDFLEDIDRQVETANRAIQEYRLW